MLRHPLGCDSSRPYYPALRASTAGVTTWQRDSLAISVDEIIKSGVIRRKSGVIRRLDESGFIDGIYRGK
jgi:hypothetical protein